LVTLQSRHPKDEEISMNPSGTSFHWPFLTAAMLLFALLAAPASADGPTLRNVTLMSGNIEIPVEIATPAGKGPFPPVLFIHAKRGYDENERRHITELAQQG
jgi:carboxymethylenebutenolidase